MLSSPNKEDYQDALRHVNWDGGIPTDKSLKYFDPIKFITPFIEQRDKHWEGVWGSFVKRVDLLRRSYADLLKVRNDEGNQR